jgi:hypothetical protein
VPYRIAELLDKKPIERMSAAAQSAPSLYKVTYDDMCAVNRAAEQFEQ